MLTNSEKRWLQLRKLYAGVNYFSYYSCMHCPEYNIGRWYGYKHPCSKACLSNGCPNIDIRSSGAVFDYVKALEFEARVAALLAEILPKALTDPWFIKNAKHITADATLKWARLSVEEEMDADMDK